MPLGVLIPGATAYGDTATSGNTPTGSFGVFTSTNTRIRTQLGPNERDFEFPYTAATQEEAWLLQTLGYQAA